MSNREYWEMNLKAYRLKKAIRMLINKFGVIKLAKLLGVSKQYINNWSKEYLPKKEFIDKLKELEKQNDNPTAHR